MNNEPKSREESLKTDDSATVLDGQVIDVEEKSKPTLQVIWIDNDGDYS
jgi:hypothetical protein